VKTKV